ncbi:MAG TPA: ParB/RepB/Spo0J family partition protein [Bryobacteraceae bacterium]|jgi:ParB family chromosome partitioning protein|nr:ParB/RepB/Spo0J family partition protein [Bryobacteraceae bacterium]
MNKPENPRKALGRGLGSLLPTRPPNPPATPHAPEPETPQTLPVDLIDANPLQPRRMFQNERLAELAQSIRSNGIVQPLVVRRMGDRYQLVAGERRWRAAKLADVAEVPVVIRDIPDERLLEISLIENIQREELNAIETAHAFARLAEELQLSPEQIGVRTGKDRSTISNFVRLLQLPEDLQQLVAERRLSGGHARCLLSLPTAALQREVAEKAVAQGWSVRQTERTTQKMMADRQPKHVDDVQVDPNVKAAIQEMERTLGTKVKIVEKGKKGGRIEIEYYSPEDLDRIYEVIVK